MVIKVIILPLYAAAALAGFLNNDSIELQYDKK